MLSGSSKTKTKNKRKEAEQRPDSYRDKPEKPERNLLSELSLSTPLLAYEFLYITRHTPILHFQFSIACLHIHLSVNPFDSIKGWDTNTLPLVFHGEESPILKEKQKTKSPSISGQSLTYSIVITDSRLRVVSQSNYLISDIHVRTIILALTLSDVFDIRI